MPRGSIKKLDHRVLERATYDCLLDLELDKEYIKNDFHAKVAIHYGMLSGHVIAQNGEHAITRVSQTVSRVLKSEGWNTYTKEVPIPGLFTSEGKLIARGVRYIRRKPKKTVWSRKTAHLYPDVVKKFWAQVEVNSETECWPWSGDTFSASRKQGTWIVGRFAVQKKKLRHVYAAHRFLWAIEKGYPSDALEIRRDCNNPLCVNINHLSIGTRNDTIDAMKERGSTQSRNLNAKKYAHENIVADRKNGLSYAQLMEKYGIKSKGTISYIINKSLASEEEQ